MINSINAAFKDRIDNYLFSIKWEKELHNKTKTIEYYMADLDINGLRELLNTDRNIKLISYAVEGNEGQEYIESYIEEIRPLTDSEYAAELEQCLNYRKSSIYKIQTWIDLKPEYSLQIFSYLKRHDITIKELHFKDN